MKAIAVLFVSLLSLSTLPCRADQTADTLFKSCKLAVVAIDNANPSYVGNPYDTGFCVGYMQAMSEAG